MLWDRIRLGEPWICPLNITTLLAPRDMRGREEAHAEKNKGTAVEYELLDMYSLFPFKNRLRHIGAYVYSGYGQIFI